MDDRFGGVGVFFTKGDFGVAGLGFTGSFRPGDEDHSCLPTGEPAAFAGVFAPPPRLVPHFGLWVRTALTRTLVAYQQGWQNRTSDNWLESQTFCATRDPGNET